MSDLKCDACGADVSSSWEARFDDQNTTFCTACYKTKNAEKIIQNKAAASQKDAQSTESEIKIKTTSIQSVVITDIKIPFESMVVFMVKWAIASIPAFIILSIIFSVIFVFLGGISSFFVFR